MSIVSHTRVYGTAALAVAFLAGVVITLSFKDFYPELEGRYQRRKRRTSSVVEALDSAPLLPPVTLESVSRHASLMPPQPSTIPVGVEGLIGNTPLFKIKSLSDATGCEIWAKAEFLNGAGGSPKDRVALNMINMAEEQGLLSPGRGDTIYEGTVGSTGISLATLARARGYKAHICMPSDQSKEKSDLLLRLGAEVERVTPAPITSTQHFVNLARTRAKEHANVHRDGSQGFFADQFETPFNHQAHLKSTGPEIFAQTNGRLDAFVAGAGTGGTMSGVALYLKDVKGMDKLRIVLADPHGSGLYNKVKHGVMFSLTEREGTRRRQQVDTIVEGVGINRLTDNFDVGRELIDDAVRVSDDQACRMARWLVEHDGLFIGSSSAVNCVAAVKTAWELGPGSRVVTILCDSGTRHLSKFWKRIGEMTEKEEIEGLSLQEVLELSETGVKNGESVQLGYAS